MPSSPAIEIDFKKYGYLAEKYCNQVLPLVALDAGYRSYYVGTYSSSEGPFSRESVEYWDTRDEAEAALLSGNWTQRMTP